MPAYSSSSSEQGEEGGSQRKRTRRVRSPAARLRHASRSGAGTGESSSAAAQHRAEAGATTSASSDGLLLRNANANARSSVQASTSAAAAAAGAPQKTSDTPAHVASLACQLRAPREHHNNALVRDLDVIRCKRRLQFGDLSRHYIPYARAVAKCVRGSLAAQLPHPLSSMRSAAQQHHRMATSSDAQRRRRDPVGRPKDPRKGARVCADGQDRRGARDQGLGLVPDDGALNQHLWHWCVRCFSRSAKIARH